MTHFTELTQELKAFYGVKSLEAVAEKMGYTKASATNWRRNKALTAQAELEFIRAKNEKDMLEKNIIVIDSTQTEQTDSNISQGKTPINYYPSVSASAMKECKKIPLENALLQGVKIVNPKNLDLLQISGDSMLPYFKDGDRVLIERECDANNGDTILVSIEETLYINRIEKHPFNAEIKLISSDNQSITLKEKEKDRIKILGIVRLKLSVKVY